MDLCGLFELTGSDTPSADTYLDPLLMLSVLGNLDFRRRCRLFVAHFRKSVADGVRRKQSLTMLSTDEVCNSEHTGYSHTASI